METNLVITGFHEATQLLAKQPNMYRVVSISSPLDPITKLPDAKEILYLYFDDILKEVSPILKLRLATKKDCEQSLAFLNKGGSCLVHCYHGKSRSTAIALGYLLSKYSDYQVAVDNLLQLRIWCTPNEHVLSLMCQLLGIEAKYQNILDYIRNKQKEQLQLKLSPQKWTKQ